MHLTTLLLLLLPIGVPILAAPAASSPSKCVRDPGVASCDLKGEDRDSLHRQSRDVAARWHLDGGKPVAKVGLDECPKDFNVAKWCTPDAKTICDGTCEGTDCDGQYCEECYECDAPGW